MRLVKAASYIVRTPPPHWGGYFWYFVRLETDAGIVGWGETAILFSMYGLEKSFAQLVQDVFARGCDHAPNARRAPSGDQRHSGRWLGA